MSKLKVGTRVVVTNESSARFGEEGTVVPDRYSDAYSRVEFEGGDTGMFFKDSIAVVVVPPKSECDILVEAFKLANVQYFEAVTARRAAQKELEARARVWKTAANALTAYDEAQREKFSDKLDALGQGAQVVNRLTGSTLVKLSDRTWARTMDGDQFNSVDFDPHASLYTILHEGVYA